MAVQGSGRGEGRPRIGWDLLLVTDPCLTPDLPASVRRALQGAQPGRVALWLRAPGVTTSLRRAWAGVLRGPVDEAGAVLLGHGFEPEMASWPLDGVHLPSRASVSAGEARERGGEGWLVGRSCHDAAELASAAAQGADYATLSPLFAVPGKGAGLGEARFARLIEGARLPVVALGGLGRDEEGLRIALRAGAAAVAVRRAVFAAADPAEALARVLGVLDRARGGPS